VKVKFAKEFLIDLLHKSESKGISEFFEPIYSKNFGASQLEFC